MNQNSKEIKSILEIITARFIGVDAPYDAVVEAAMKTTDAQACSLYLEQSDANAEGPEIVMVAGAGFEQERIGKARYKKGSGLTGTIWANGNTVKYNSQAEIEDPQKGWRGSFNSDVQKKRKGWKSYSLIGVPLKVGDRIIGVIKVENKNPGPGEVFSDSDKDILETIASVITLAIEHWRISEKSYSGIINAIGDISGTMLRKDIIPSGVLYDRIVKKCIEIFNAEACSLYTEEGDEIEMKAGAGYETRRIGVRYKKGVGLTGRIWKDGRSVKFDSQEELEKPETGWSGKHNDIVKQNNSVWKCTSLIGVPLRVGESIIGVLKVENKKPSPNACFTSSELRSLEIIGSNIALFLEMMNRQRELFLKGLQAREFSHNILLPIKNSVFNIKKAIELLDPIKDADSIECLEIAKDALNEMESNRKYVFDEKTTTYKKCVTQVGILVEELERRCSNVLNEKKIKFIKSLPKEPLYINIAMEQVLQAFGNLITNSIEAMANTKDPELSISIVCEDSQVSISVADNGKGLTNEQKDDFREGKGVHSTGRKEIGTGLFMSYRLLKDNDGQIECVDVKKGCEFRIKFPVSDPMIRRVLVIDDHNATLSTFKNQAKRISNIVTIETQQDPKGFYNDGDIDFFELGKYDLVLLDCVLGAVDGITIYFKILEKNPAVAQKVILMSVQEYERQDVKVYKTYEDILSHLEKFVLEHCRG